MTVMFRVRTLPPTQLPTPVSNGAAELPLRVGPASVAAAAEGWGWLPVLSVVCALGLVILATAFTGGRTDEWWANPLFWVGFLVTAVPVAVRLLSPDASRTERIGLVSLLRLALYM